MPGHAFGTVDTAVLLAGPENHRSRRAIEKIGEALRGEPSVEYAVTRDTCTLFG